MPAPNAQFRVSGTQRRDIDRSGNEQVAWRLQLEDEKSGQTVAIVEIPAAEVLKMMAGSGGVPLDGWMAQGDLASRLGKQVVTETVAVPREALASASYGEEQTKAAQAWANEFAKTNGWDFASVNNTQSGWKATLKLWV